MRSMTLRFWREFIEVEEDLGSILNPTILHPDIPEFWAAMQIVPTLHVCMLPILPA